MWIVVLSTLLRGPDSLPGPGIHVFPAFKKKNQKKKQFTPALMQ
jgi:hypothetical protein